MHASHSTFRQFSEPIVRGHAFGQACKLLPSGHGHSAARGLFNAQRRIERDKLAIAAAQLGKRALCNPNIIRKLRLRDPVRLEVCCKVHHGSQYA